MKLLLKPPFSALKALPKHSKPPLLNDLISYQIWLELWLAKVPCSWVFPVFFLIASLL
jgi:hypothetical protein